MRRRPLRRRVQKLLDFADLRRLEVAALLHQRQHVPPGGEMMQAHVELGERLLRLGEDVVVEVDEHVLDDRVRLAYCIGSARRSAIHAAYGIPAVSPPATTSNCSKPTSRASVATAKSTNWLRMRIKDELAAIDVHRARPAGGEDERLVVEKQYRLHLEQHLGGGLGYKRPVGEVHERREF